MGPQTDCSQLHGVDPYTYLIEVPQCVSEHPAARVANLIPPLGKQHFFDCPLRSDLHGLQSL
jgi:transposase